MRAKGTEWYRRPEIILADVLQRAARDDLADRDRTMFRATVIAVDPLGGRLQNPSGSGTYQARGTDGRTIQLSAAVGPENPIGAIKARILTDGLDRLRTDQELRVFWPLHPQDQLGLPISPGEHVYVIFEGENHELGLWMSRVTGHDSAGGFVGSKSYTEPAAPTSAMDSFEDNSPQYPQDDANASMTPGKDAMGLFEEDP